MRQDKPVPASPAQISDEPWVVEKVYDADNCEYIAIKGSEGEHIATVHSYGLAKRIIDAVNADARSRLEPVEAAMHKINAQGICEKCEPEVAAKCEPKISDEEFSKQRWPQWKLYEGGDGCHIAIEGVGHPHFYGNTRCNAWNMVAKWTRERDADEN